jgi:hypothetical protein
MSRETEFYDRLEVAPDADEATIKVRHTLQSRFPPHDPVVGLSINIFHDISGSKYDLIDP